MTETNGLIHCVAFTWLPATPAAAIEAVAAGLSELRQHLGLPDYHFGPDLGLAIGNADFGVVARFPSEEAWRRYMDHPEHRQLINQRVQPILAAKASFQIPSGPQSAPH